MGGLLGRSSFSLFPEMVLIYRVGWACFSVSTPGVSIYRAKKVSNPFMQSMGRFQKAAFHEKLERKGFLSKWNSRGTVQRGIIR
jgi:hypothetical protein